MSGSTVDAVKALRAHLGESQQAFSNKLGLSIRAIANYEKARIPSTLALHRLLKLAHEAGRDDLADVFREAYWKSKSRTFPGLTDEESAWVEVLCDVFSSRDCSNLEAAWDGVRKSITEAASMIISKAETVKGIDDVDSIAEIRGHLWAANRKAL